MEQSAKSEILEKRMDLIAFIVTHPDLPKTEIDAIKAEIETLDNLIKGIDYTRSGNII